MWFMRVPLLTGLLVIVLVTPLGLERAEGAATSCAPDDARIVGRSAVGLAYYEEPEEPELSACLSRSGRRMSLTNGEDVQTSVRMAGRFVAVRNHYDSGSPDDCYSMAVVVRDITRGDPKLKEYPRRVFEESRFNCSGRPADEEYNLPTDLILKANGAVAYVRCFSSGLAMPFGGPYRCDPTKPRQVIKHDARAPRNGFEILDTGMRISNLEYRNGLLRWRAGDRHRRVRLR